MSRLEQPTCRGPHDYPKPTATYSCDRCGLDICESCRFRAGDDDDDLCPDCLQKSYSKSKRHPWDEEADKGCQHPAHYRMSDWECKSCWRRRSKQTHVCPYCDGDHRDCSSS